MMNYYRFQLQLAIIRVKSRLGLDWRPKRLRTKRPVDVSTDINMYSDAHIFNADRSWNNPVWYNNN